MQENLSRKKWYNKPYANTKVTVQETLSQIKGLLMKYNVIGIQDTQYQDIIQIRFVLEDNGEQIPFEFTIKLPSNKDEKSIESQQRQYMRAYYYYMKSKIEMIKDFGIKAFKNEFMGERLLKLPNGQLRTLGQVIKDQEEKLSYVENLFLPLKEGV